MAERRVPLGHLPNAANSPFRQAAASLGTKRPRAHAADQRDLAYAQQPPAKKQIVETDDAENRRALPKKTGPSPKKASQQTQWPQNRPTTLQRRLEAARDVRTKQSDKQAKASQESLSEIREWQRHYKKLFPRMTFYFDQVSEDVKHKISRQLLLLGSREEAFFSKTITHVVTTRAIPNESSSSSSVGRSPPKASNGTVNPSMLKKGTAAGVANNMLIQAKEMGIKVWSLEKLQRMLTTMFNTETGEAPVQPYNAKSQTAVAKTNQQTQLSQMLQQEKEHGQTNMDWTIDMAAFRGYFIYVHDVDELTKPVIVRDYTKAPTKEQGKWPQLRVSGAGRCPFIEDPNARYERPQAEKAPRTRAAAAREKAPATAERVALAETNGLNRPQRAASAQAEDTFKPLDPPKLPAKRGSTDNLPLFGSAQASLRQHPRFAGGEPIASGVQPSNVTSAIRSQMISSTAAAPGGKAGATKELNRLKRQVLERNNPTNPYLSNDLRAAINNGGRGQKRKGQDSLAHIKEEEATSEVPERPARVIAPARKKKAAEKELKPGYCENCRAKFQDFDEHILSRTHRKFATTDENWTELDNLLGLLVRPEKVDEIEVE